MVVAIEVATRPGYSVHVGAGVSARLASELGERPRFLLTDATVWGLHAGALGDLDYCGHLAIEPGERSKSLAVLERVLEAMAAAGLDRRSELVAFGGGVTGDLGGLAASLYQRGIAVVMCPTTLLSQVDASVGGKTAVNLAAGKNLVGTFWQPRAVYADVGLLATLSSDELRSGLGEVVKTALVAGEELLARVEARAGALCTRDPGALEEIVADCVRAKAGFVSIDPEEAGLRRILNLGHTFGHAIEHAAGYGRVPHGVAVAVGIALALEASRASGLLIDPELPERVRALLLRLDLPVGLADLRASADRPLTAAELTRGMRHDKKGTAGEPRFVLPRSAGHCAVDVTLEPTLMAELLA